MRVAIRLLEALCLSALAGAFVWTIGALFLGGFRLPVLFPALLGFFTGGAATLRTLGVLIHDRRLRMVLAAVCAAVGLAAVQALDYASAIHLLRREQRAIDWTATPSEVDARVAAELRAATGYDGPAGYVIGSMRDGVALGPVRLRGAAVIGYWLLELGIAVGVATRWAGGPRPAAG